MFENFNVEYRLLIQNNTLEETFVLGRLVYGQGMPRTSLALLMLNLYVGLSESGPFITALNTVLVEMLPRVLRLSVSHHKRHLRRELMWQFLLQDRPDRRQEQLRS